jgi:hypothetical protein
MNHPEILGELAEQWGSGLSNKKKGPMLSQIRTGGMDNVYYSVVRKHKASKLETQTG